MESVGRVRSDTDSRSMHTGRGAGAVTDEEAMARLQASGDRGAFAQIVRRWRARIVSLCRRMLNDADRAEDVTQDVFARLLAKPESYGHGARFSTFIWRVAVNACLDERRRNARSPEAVAPADGVEAAGAAQPSPLAAAVRGERAKMVRAALDRLPDHYRAVVVLRHYEGLKFREVAAVLEIPLGTVKSRMAEALDRLAQILEPLAESGTKQKERRP